MAVDRLQEKIRKLKNPLVVDFTMLPKHIPQQIHDVSEDFCDGYCKYSKELLLALKETVPAVRFDMGFMALLGTKGLDILTELLRFARKQGYYVFLQTSEALSQLSAIHAAENLFDANCPFCFDGLIVAGYIGGDGIAPYVDRLKQTGKDLFVAARTANRSASMTQDILSGSRLAHMVKTDIVNRYSQDLIGRSGYSQVALLAAASSPDSLRNIRTKYKSLFLLLDGLDYPNANAKNCSYAFDNLGHGAIACAGLSVTAAWGEDDECEEYIASAVRAAERAKKNLNRYISIL